MLLTELGLVWDVLDCFGGSFLCQRELEGGKVRNGCFSHITTFHAGMPNTLRILNYNLAF